MDLALEVQGIGDKIQGLEVSILVFMDLALEVQLVKVFLIIMIVSILVFMDLALEVCAVLSVTKVQLSFNPCFYGSCSRSRGNNDDLLASAQFQSLFLWILLSKPPS